MHEIDTSTQVCAVIGNPIEHSLSPLIHNAAFRATLLNYVYVAFQVEDVASCLDGMRAMPGFRGMSVTLPHKMAVMPYLDEIEPMAKNVGCVNTITNCDGRLIGSTTDGPGTVKAFEDNEVSLEGKKVLFVGSGGAVRAVAFAMVEIAKAGQVSILGRTPSRVETIVSDLKARTSGTTIAAGDLCNDLAESMESHDIIIQGTPIGMYPNNTSQTPVPREMFSPEHVVFDMVYRPLKTRFLIEAEESGCKTISGIHMLINQAAIQFETWTGVSAPTEIMLETLVGHLQL